MINFIMNLGQSKYICTVYNCDIHEENVMKYVSVSKITNKYHMNNDVPLPPFSTTAYFLASSFIP